MESMESINLQISIHLFSFYFMVKTIKKGSIGIETNLTDSFYCKTCINCIKLFGITGILIG